MMISKVKDYVRQCMGKRKSFVFNGSRNQIDKFDGVIIRMYPSIFIIKLETGALRSYSYSDLLISNLEIID